MGFFGLPQISQPEIGIAQVGPRLGIILLQGDSLGQDGDRQIELPGIRQRVAQVVVRHRGSRVQIQRPAEGGDRLGEIALRRKGDAQISDRINVIGLYRKSLLITLQSRGGLTFEPVGAAQVVVRQWRIRLKLADFW